MVTALGGLLCLLLSGCETGSSPPSMMSFAVFPVPDKWKAHSTTGPEYNPDRFWISDFGDPELDEFVREVLACNKDIKTAKARIEIAANNARGVGSDIYPTLDGKFFGERRKRNFAAFPIPGLTDRGIDPLTVTNNQFDFLLDAAWEVDLWGKTKAAQSEAIAEMEATQNDMAALQLSIAALTVKTWFLLADGRQQVRLARETVATFKKTENSIRDRFERGIQEGVASSYGSQLLLAQADVATATDALAAREEIVGRTARQLEILAGRYPCGEAGKMAKLPSFPQKKPIDLPCTILERRPDLVAAERRLAAADQRLVQAKKAALPSINLTSSFGTSTNEIRKLLSGEYTVWHIAGDVVMPIFAGGLLDAVKQTTMYQIQAAKNEYEKVILKAFADVENALAAEKYLADRIRSVTDGARFSREAFQRSGEEYANGTGDLLTMLTSQARMFSQESQLISLRRQQLEARVDLHLALAGSFECISHINTDPMASTPEPD